MLPPAAVMALTARATTAPMVRAATEADISAIICLVLTSFRQFVLFSLIYAPLDVDLNHAHDTIFFWRRSMLLDLLNPDCEIRVAELPISELGISSSSSSSSLSAAAATSQHEPPWIIDVGDGDRIVVNDTGVKVRPRRHRELKSKADTPPLGGDSATNDGGTRAAHDEKSRRMLEWLVREAGLTQVNSVRGTVVVGFSIWRSRGAASSSAAASSSSSSGRREDAATGKKRAEAEAAINAELKAHPPRRDVDTERMTAYRAAGDRLIAEYYTLPPGSSSPSASAAPTERDASRPNPAPHPICNFQLDFLCVDFRARRRGVGGALVAPGLQAARARRLPACTEASDMGASLYRSLGAVDVGAWIVELPGIRRDRTTFPILRWDAAVAG